MKCHDATPVDTTSDVRIAELHAIISREQRRVVGWLRHRLPPEVDAEDVAQNAVLAALGAVSNYRGEGTLEAWYWGVVKMCRLRALARVDRSGQRLDPKALGDPRCVQADLDFERVGEPEAARSEVRKLFDQLGDTDRELLEDFHLNGTPITDIATKSTRTEDSIRVMLSRARARARAAVALVLGVVATSRRWLPWLLQNPTGMVAAAVVVVAAAALAVADTAGADVGTVPPPVEPAVTPTERAIPSSFVPAIEAAPSTAAPKMLIVEPEPEPTPAASAEPPTPPEPAEPLVAGFREELPTEEPLLLIDAGPAGQVYVGEPPMDLPEVEPPLP